MAQSSHNSPRTGGASSRGRNGASPEATRVRRLSDAVATEYNGMGGTTVAGDEYPIKDFDLNGKNKAKPGFDAGSNGAAFPLENVPVASAKFAETALDWLANNNPLFVRIGDDGVIGALHKLDRQLQNEHHLSIISKKKPVTWTGVEIQPGQIGLINYGGLPEIITRAGRYPRFPFRLWWARSWEGTQGISDTVIDFQGLTIVQVSQNQAAVICDPQNQVFVVKNGGFVAFAMQGAYRVLGVIDQTHLSTRVTDPTTGATLGYTQEVRMDAFSGSSKNRGNHEKRREYVAALFLNIPANNCVILQRGDDLEVVGAGQHCITNPNVTLRGIFTCGECQLEMPTKDIFTRDQVPVSLRIYLKWQLVSPLKLATHGYETPYDALRDKAQSILTQIVAHLDYSSMVKQRSLGPDAMNDAEDPASAFLDALRTRAMDDLLLAATEYGIVLKDLAVIDRQFKGQIASTMDKLTTRALEAQVEAANVDRENSNKVKREQGLLEVSRVKAQQTRTEADAKAYAVVAEAKSGAEALSISAKAKALATPQQIQAEADAKAYAAIAKAKADAESLAISTQAEARAIEIRTKAEAEAIRIKAVANEAVRDTFAREVELRGMDIKRVSAFGNRTVFVGDTAGAASLGASALNAFGMAKGLEAGKSHV